MAASTDLDTARSILGANLFGPEEIGKAFGSVEGIEPGQSVPFSPEELREAARNDEFLVLRMARIGGEALTLLWLIRHFAADFDPAFLRKMGYQLRSEWGIELEPLAAVDTCRAGWALVRRTILDKSRNLNHEEQDAEIAQYAAARGTDRRTRRRSAVEIAYDTVLVRAITGERLLQDSFDWSSSRTLDGGLLNLGEFRENGMKIFSYSQGIRHGTLGVCPNIDPP